MATNMNISGSLIVGGGVQLSNLTGQKVLVTDSSKNIAESDIDTSVLSYLEGASSNLQEQIEKNYSRMYDTTDININKMNSLEDIFNTMKANKVFFSHIGGTNGKIFDQIVEEIASNRQGASAAVCYGELLVIKTDSTGMFIYFERLDKAAEGNTSAIFFKMYSILGDHGFDSKWKKITTTDV